MATKTAVTAKGGDSTIEQVTVSFKDSEGKEQTETLNLHKSVLALISEGMSQAVKLEGFWRKNCVPIVEEFFGEDPFPNMAKDDLVKELRKSEHVTRMYAVFQTRHKDWPLAQRQQNIAKNNPESEEGKTAIMAYRGIIASVRATANNQAVKVCRYYAEEKKGDKSAEQREQQSARQMIEETIADWSAKVATQRGVFKLAAEKVLLNAAIESLREVLADNTRALSIAARTSLIALDVAKDVKPVGRAAQFAAQKAGEVATLTAEEYEATQQ
jgi:hypothetical protein